MGRSVVRLKDIAEKTGFSANTVSLALRESPRIPEETREKIKKAARELNYLPNEIAKSLVSRQTKTIGLVLTHLTNPLLTHAAQAIELALAEMGYVTMLATSNNELEEEKRVVETFRSRQVDGMLVFPRDLQNLDHIRRLRQAHYPIVVMRGRTEGLDVVGVDDEVGAFRAVQHLIEQGHTRIGLIDTDYENLDFDAPESMPSKVRGYFEALNSAGIQLDPTLFVGLGQGEPDDGALAASRLMGLDLPPTAIFAVTDIVAIGAQKWCLRNGIQVPDDICIVGYDNTPVAPYAHVPLTSVNYDVDLVARNAVRALLELVETPEKLPDPKIQLIAPQLVIRESSSR